MGLELWMGNREGADGYVDRSVFPSYNQHELETYLGMGEVAFMGQKQHLASESIRANPATFVVLTLKRFDRFWTGTGTRPAVLAYVLHACATTSLGMWGLFRLLRRKLSVASFSFCAVFLLFPLPYYVTHADFRYRLVLDPLLIALSALSLEAMASHAQRRRMVTL